MKRTIFDQLIPPTPPYRMARPVARFTAGDPAPFNSQMAEQLQKIQGESERAPGKETELKLAEVIAEADAALHHAEEVQIESATPEVQASLAQLKEIFSSDINAVRERASEISQPSPETPPANSNPKETPKTTMEPGRPHLGKDMPTEAEIAEAKEEARKKAAREVYMGPGTAHPSPLSEIEAMQKRLRAAQEAGDTAAEKEIRKGLAQYEPHLKKPSAQGEAPKKKEGAITEKEKEREKLFAEIGEAHATGKATQVEALLRKVQELNQRIEKDKEEQSKKPIPPESEPVKLRRDEMLATGKTPEESLRDIRARQAELRSEGQEARAKAYDRAAQRYEDWLREQAKSKSSIPEKPTAPATPATPVEPAESKAPEENKKVEEPVETMAERSYRFGEKPWQDLMAKEKEKMKRREEAQKRREEEEKKKKQQKEREPSTEIGSETIYEKPKEKEAEEKSQMNRREFLHRVVGLPKESLVEKPRRERMGGLLGFMRESLRWTIEKSGTKPWLDTLEPRLKSVFPRRMAEMRMMQQSRAQNKLEVAKDKLDDWQARMEDAGFPMRLFYANRMRKWQGRMNAAEARVNTYDTYRQRWQERHNTLQQQIANRYEQELAPYREKMSELKKQEGSLLQAKEKLGTLHANALRKLSQLRAQAEKKHWWRSTRASIEIRKAEKAIRDVNQRIIQADRELTKLHAPLSRANAKIEKWEAKKKTIAQLMEFPEAAGLKRIPRKNVSIPKPRGIEASPTESERAPESETENERLTEQWHINAFVEQWNGANLKPKIEHFTDFARFVGAKREQKKETGTPELGELFDLAEQYLREQTSEKDMRTFSKDKRFFIEHIQKP